MKTFEKCKLFLKAFLSFFFLFSSLFFSSLKVMKLYKMKFLFLFLVAVKIHKIMDPKIYSNLPKLEFFLLNFRQKSLSYGFWIVTSLWNLFSLKWSPCGRIFKGQWSKYYILIQTLKTRMKISSNPNYFIFLSVLWDFHINASKALVSYQNDTKLKNIVHYIILEAFINSTFNFNSENMLFWFLIMRFPSFRK